MMTTLVMMIIGGFVVIAGASGCLIPSANYGGTAQNGTDTSLQQS